MEELETIKNEIRGIKERNARVELDKAWETSWARRFLILVLTYTVIVLFFYFARLPEPFLNAIVPTLGFLLSTLSVGYVKRVWVKRKKA